MDILQRLKEHDWAPGDRVVAQAASDEVTALRRRVSALSIALLNLADDLGQERANFEDARATAGRYLARARNAEDLVKMLQARLAAQAPASTEAA